MENKRGDQAMNFEMKSQSSQDQSYHTGSQYRANGAKNEPNQKDKSSEIQQNANQTQFKYNTVDNYNNGDHLSEKKSVPLIFSEKSSMLSSETSDAYREQLGLIQINGFQGLGSNNSMSCQSQLDYPQLKFIIDVARTPYRNDYILEWINSQVSVRNGN